MSISSILVPAVLFFALGMFACIIKSDLKFPPDMHKMIVIYLLVGIGLHGGKALTESSMSSAIPAVLAALILGFGLPIIAYIIMRFLGKIDPMNSAAIAAHYGSVSAGTYMTAVAFLNGINVEYEAYPVVMLAIMESPAIIIGLILAGYSRRVLAMQQRGIGGAAVAGDHGDQKGMLKHLVIESFTNGSILLLFGSMAIGSIVSEPNMTKIEPFFDKIFMGALCLFLLDMGMEAGKRISEFKDVGFFLVIFGVIMPLIGASVGIVIGHFWLQYSIGGVTLVTVLAASCSYIAVPPAMRLAVPEANPSFYLTLSLGLTFPFNVLAGIPLYYAGAQWLAHNY
ncbi:sodium-dependent bicarbonate transport family permease [Nitrosomonas sp. Is37]|uniref:sodium-dependent bicarbonate transport family permease n=1 Tax=Nitrosomonas sp. Is37 TaxID=3080535 RepID=UPI00294AEEFC|nr:sodium-dependent bicarbonate transport family permease [Nitrosomonas sp. Is37]MDV6345474.1 sodium-dependent bicarbonate transport family permease [Nitrosomonas sp. Is37]